MVGAGRMANREEDSHLRRELFQLMSNKNQIEAEVQQQSNILLANNIGMHEPLVDSEGFPRNDIDVYQVRTARHKIICLNNDLKAIMTKIEDGLHRLHAAQGSEVVGDEPMDVEPLPEPFARVSLVSPGSPANMCGLQVDDQVLEFGSVNKNNFKSMQDLATVVHHSEGKRVSVIIKRKGRHSAITLELFPQVWSGQGLLGCKIDPLPFETVER